MPSPVVINHEAIQPKSIPVEILYCRKDVILDWDFKSSILKAPYWRLYRPYNDKGILYYREQVIKMQPGEIWLIAPETEFDTATDGGKIEKFYLHFLAGGAFLNCHDFCLRLPASALLLELIDQAGEQLAGRQAAERLSLLCAAIVNVALSLLPPDYLDNYTQINSALIQILHYLQQNPTQSPSNNELAAMAKMSRSIFCKKFLDNFGIPPQRYLLDIKLRHAALLLVRSNLSINEIAAEAGFCDRYYFSRMFRKYRGISPAQFRKQGKFSGREE